MKLEEAQSLYDRDRKLAILEKREENERLKDMPICLRPNPGLKFPNFKDWLIEKNIEIKD